MKIAARQAILLMLTPIIVGAHCPGNGAHAQVSSRLESGTLSSDDPQLDDGEYFDRFTIQGRRGELFTVELRSGDFDTFLQIHATDAAGDIDENQSWFNDDYQDSQSRSRLEIELPEDGTYIVFVTSYEGGETGRYELTITSNSGRVESGKLGGKDDRLETGEYFDIYQIDAAAGATYVIDLYSDDFDTYLFVRNPDGPDFSLDNDDHEGDVHRSQIVMRAPADGVYDVYVTSFEPNETGEYRLTISQPVASSGEPALREEVGELSTDDGTLDSGEYFDSYTLELEQGETIEISLDSMDFDTYLFVRQLEDESFQVDNDDENEDSTNSLIRMTAPQSGAYEVYVTSYKPGETGSYRLAINSPGSPGRDFREETGTLAKGDQRLDDGEFFDTYEIHATAGESYVLDLYSEDFDTYLFVRGIEDSKFEVDNDDFDGNTNHSQIRMTASVTGTYVVYVTSYEAGETGRYRMTISSGGSGGMADRSDVPARRETGELESGDETLDSGEYRDVYEFEGQPGQHVRIELRSDDFDTYLILQDPQGGTQDNDDYDGRRDMSVIELELTEFGTYIIAVTSFKNGETGAYELLIEFDEPAADLPGRDRVQIEEDGSYAGSLSDGDSRRDGRYVDQYSISLAAGERIIIRMESDDFDSLMILTYPDGTEVEFDDELSSVNAAIDLIPEQSGRYRVAATSYGRGASGDYTLNVTFNAPGRPIGRRGNVPITPDRRILGVFVGLADYEGDENDLDYCDRDAQVLHDILQREFNMQPDDSVLLLNDEATIESITAALTRIGQRAGPNDLLLFFYSGHGDQIAGAEDVFDPDGIHETLSLYDGELLDDDFAALFNSSDAGISLVAIDACFSGGFAKDVVSTRGRMGVFSSEEDVLSVVPGKFRAGGYLSRFLSEAVSERRHDSDLNGDGDLTAHELSHFLAERYVQEVRSTKETEKSGEEFVSPDDDLSFQRLVIDRGGLSHDQVLFSWN